MEEKILYVGETIGIGDVVRILGKNLHGSGVVTEIIDNTGKENFVKHFHIEVTDDFQEDVHVVVLEKCEYGKYGEFSIMKIHGVPTTPSNFERLKNLSVKYKEKNKNPIESLKPNTRYHCKIEGYVRTKKDWFTIHRTTAKMVMFEGGRCKIENVTDLRRKE